MRELEEDGKAYHFTTREAMEADIRHHRYLEYGELNGNLYGSKIDSILSVIRSGKMCVLDCSPAVSCLFFLLSFIHALPILPFFLSSLLSHSSSAFAHSSFTSALLLLFIISTFTLHFSFTCRPLLRSPSSSLTHRCCHLSLVPITPYLFSLLSSPSSALLLTHRTWSFLLSLLHLTSHLCYMLFLLVGLLLPLYLYFSLSHMVSPVLNSSFLFSLFISLLPLLPAHVSYLSYCSYLVFLILPLLHLLFVVLTRFLFHLLLLLYFISLSCALLFPISSFFSFFTSPSLVLIPPLFSVLFFFPLRRSSYLPHILFFVLAVPPSLSPHFTSFPLAPFFSSPSYLHLPFLTYPSLPLTDLSLSFQLLPLRFLFLPNAFFPSLSSSFRSSFTASPPSHLA